MSQPASSGAGRGCGWCDASLGSFARPTQIYCGRKCHQSAWRLRRRSQVVTPAADPHLPLARCHRFHDDGPSAAAGEDQ